jgi:uncharacterized protein (DUF1330 family)
MSAYIIVSYDVADHEGFGAYPPAAQALVAKHGGHAMVVDFAAETREGEARAVNIVLSFPSMEAARAFYDDPEYAPVRQIRLDNTANGTLTIAREFVPPGA